MRHAGSDLRRHRALGGMGQGLARLHLGGDVRGQDIGAVPGLIGGQRDADAPARGRMRDLEHLRLAGDGAVHIGADAVKGLGAQHLVAAEADDPGGGTRKHREKLVVGKRIAIVAVHMGDMGGDHGGDLTDAGLGFGQHALGLFQRGVGRGQRAVGGGQPFGMVQRQFGKLFRAGAQKLFLTFDLGDVGIDRDPAALRQRRPLDGNPAAIGTFALHVMGLKGAGLFDALAHGGLGVVLGAVFAAPDQIADRVLECGAGTGQLVRQVEHRLIGPIDHRQSQIRIENRDRLLNQVQPGAGQCGVPVVSHGHD